MAIEEPFRLKRTVKTNESGEMKKTVLITGGTRGIGLGIASELAMNGYNQLWMNFRSKGLKSCMSGEMCQ